jgi:hypothetical protein
MLLADVFEGPYAVNAKNDDDNKGECLNEIMVMRPWHDAALRRSGIREE